MEQPSQKASRLLTALEEMVEQEGMYLRGGFYDLAVELRQRTDPLVQDLAGLAGAPGVDELRPRVAAVLGRSACHDALLAMKMTELSDEIHRIDQARHRTAQVAPAYAAAPAPALPRFQAAG